VFGHPFGVGVEDHAFILLVGLFAGGSYLVLHSPVLVSVPFGIPQVGSAVFGSSFHFCLQFSGFFKLRHH
jgi:hypothetical protein